MLKNCTNFFLLALFAVVLTACAGRKSVKEFEMEQQSRESVPTAEAGAADMVAEPEPEIVEEKESPVPDVQDGSVEPTELPGDADIAVEEKGAADSQVAALVEQPPEPEINLPETAPLPQWIMEAPDNVRFEYEAAVNRIEIGEDAAATRLFERFIVNHPKYPGAYVNLAILYEKEGRTSDAVKLLNQAISAAPGSVYALNRLGLIKRQQGEFEEAEIAWLQATEANPRYAYAWYNLGVLYDMYLQNLPAALDSYRNYQQLVAPAEADPMVARWISDLERRLEMAQRVQSGGSS